MYLSAYHFDGDPARLAVAHDEMTAAFPPEDLTCTSAYAGRASSSLTPAPARGSRRSSRAPSSRRPGRGRAPDAADRVAGRDLVDRGGRVTTADARRPRSPRSTRSPRPRWSAPARSSAVELDRGGDRADRAAQPGPERGRHADVRAGASRPPRRRAARTRRSPACRYLLKDLIVEIAGTAASRGLAFPARRRVHYDSELVARLRRAGLVILGQDQHPRVRHGARPASRCCTAPPATRGTPSARPAAPAAGRQPRSRRGWCRWRTATTWAVRCATRPRRAACSASSRPAPATRSAPSTATPSSGWACEHALTVSVRDSAALLDATAGPASATPTPRRRPRRPFLAEVGADPGRLRIGYTTRTPDGDAGAPGLRRRARGRLQLCTDLGHEVVEADLPGLDPRGRRGDRDGLQRRDRVDRRLLDPAARPRARRRRARAAHPRVLGAGAQVHRRRLPAGDRGPASGSPAAWPRCLPATSTCG